MLIDCLHLSCVTFTLRPSAVTPIFLVLKVLPRTTGQSSPNIFRTHIIYIYIYHLDITYPEKSGKLVKELGIQPRNLTIYNLLVMQGESRVLTEEIHRDAALPLLPLQVWTAPPKPRALRFEVRVPQFC